MSIIGLIGLGDAFYLWLVEKLGVGILPFWRDWYIAAHPPGSSYFQISFGLIKSPHISFALLGLIGFLAILIASWSEGMASEVAWRIKKGLWPLAAFVLQLAQVVMTAFGVAVIATLAYQAIFIIGVVCPLCVLSWASIFSLFIISLLRIHQSITLKVSVQYG